MSPALVLRITVIAAVLALLILIGGMSMPQKFCVGNQQFTQHAQGKPMPMQGGSCSDWR